MPLDLSRLRADTPASAQVIHFNNAGSALPPQVVLDTQIAHLKREAEIGGYEAADEAKDRLAAVYDSIAKLMGARADEIALVENATIAWLAGFHALTHTFKAGDKILTCEADYAANFVSLLQLKKHQDVEIVVVPSDETGTLDNASALKAVRGV